MTDLLPTADNPARVIVGDSLDVLRRLPDGCVHACITSPPYWSLRDYAGCSCVVERVADPACGRCGGTGKLADVAASQIGLEPTPGEFVARLVEVFEEVRRVLHPSGTCWVNMGDSYVSNGFWPNAPSNNGGATGLTRGNKSMAARGRQVTKAPGLKPKDLVGVPWRLAFALQAAGWVLRSEIIWAKPSCMPESVTDRCTKSHEQVFMFAKAKWSGPEPGPFAYISDDDARWLALFLDTEGNICVKRVERNGRQWFGAQIAIAGTSRPLLETAQAIIGAGAVLERVGKNAPMFYLQLSNRQAAALLHRIYPFLIVKRRQARIAIHVQTLLRHRGGRGADRFRTDAEVAVLESLWMRNKSCNRFGDPDVSDVPEPVYGRWSACEDYMYDAEAVKEAAGEWMQKYADRVRVAGSKVDKSRRDGDRVSEGSRHALGDPAGRNKRTVWTIASDPYPEAHFATFPPALVEPMVRAGSSEKGVCPECGNPWRRVLERTKGESDRKPRGKAITSPRQDGNPWNENNGRGFIPPAILPLGWEPTCKHGHEAVPSLILDPFAGSGTTLAVAVKLKRRALGIELNAEYAALAEKRLAEPLGVGGMFDTGAPVVRSLFDDLEGE